MKKSFLLLVICSASLWARGAAIITLEMPVGARQLGMAEAGVAFANDANAVYYNPAGLAFGPISNEWELTREAVSTTPHFSAIAARSRSGFLAKSDLWTGTTNGILHFDGKRWRNFHSETPQGAARVRDVVRTYAGTERHLDSLTQIVKNFNNVETATDESYLVEVRLPWNLVVSDSITAIFYEDRTEKLWVGTQKGLFRFDGKSWRNFHIELDSVNVQAITAQGATIWIATSDGLYSYRNGMFERKGKVLPSQNMVSLAWSDLRQELYVAVQGAGVARLQPKKSPSEKDRWSLYNLEDGLMDLNPLSLVVDSSGHIWTAHNAGVSHFNLRKWEQIRFDNNQVNDLSVAADGAIWIATNKGVWRHLPDYATAKGRKVEIEMTRQSESGSWSHYHTGNGMKSNQVWKVLPQGKDVWFSTSEGMERFNHAESQLSFFYEKLLPVLNIPDLYHLFVGATFPAGEWGTIGGFVNFISFGQTLVSTESVNEDLSTFNSSETVGGISYGTRLSKKWGLGLNFKFFYSSLSTGAAMGEPNATTASYAIDFGLLGRHIWRNLNFGLALSNIGPNVYYIDKSSDDPIPLTWRIGLAYDLLETVDHRLAMTADYNRQVIYTDNRGNAQPFYISAWKAWAYPDGRTPNNGAGSIARMSLMQGVFNTGVEYIYANTIALRAGYLYDEGGQREEAHWGLGVMLSDVLQLDIASIQGVGNREGVRDGQLRFGLLFKF
ncbi:MAG: PorV/PorQ family protein [Fibrobacter sp.]|nr:PorV/PorQ family protein [Fibrobacter sp.]